MKSAAAATLSALPLPPPQKLHRRRSSALPTLKKVSTDGDHHFEFCLQEFICDEIRNSRSASRTAAAACLPGLWNRKILAQGNCSFAVLWECFHFKEKKGELLKGILSSSIFTWVNNGIPLHDKPCKTVASMLPSTCHLPSNFLMRKLWPQEEEGGGEGDATSAVLLLPRRQHLQPNHTELFRFPFVLLVDEWT